VNAKLELEREDVRQSVRGEFSAALEGLTQERTNLLNQVLLLLTFLSSSLMLLQDKAVCLSLFKFLKISLTFVNMARTYTYNDTYISVA
jgi:hypothetical protein